MEFGTYKRVYEMEVQEFIDKATAKYGSKFNYDKVKHIGTDQSKKLEIECPEHGTFFQTYNNHLSGSIHGCPRCGNKKVLDLKDFIARSLEVHQDKYDYSNVLEYGGTDTEVPIRCKSCNETFYQKPHYHIAGSNCPKCVGRHYKFLYVLRSGVLTKIGISNNPSKRIRSLSNSLGVSWNTSLVVELDNARVKEKELHFLYRSYRHRGLSGDGHTEVFKLCDKTHQSVLDLLRGFKEVSA
jgi:Zn finger protein HypA/HybF involved in hydrogenase expression